jgi:hypothetical protein
MLLLGKEQIFHGAIMVKEHKANASLMFKVVITLIGYWIASTLAVIIYSMFFKIDANTLLVCMLFPTPIIWFMLLGCIGLIYKWMESLSTYDKYKLWCVFVRDLIITILATLLATLTTIELYQIEHPLRFSKFILLVGLFLVAGLIIISLLAIAYLKIIRKLKRLNNI